MLRPEEKVSSSSSGRESRNLRTATQKNISENRRNITGSVSHPRARKVARKATSIGSVTKMSVIMTSRGLGWWAGGVRWTLSVEAIGKVDIVVA